MSINIFRNLRNYLHLLLQCQKKRGYNRGNTRDNVPLNLTQPDFIHAVTLIQAPYGLWTCQHLLSYVVQQKMLTRMNGSACEEHGCIYWHMGPRAKCIECIYTQWWAHMLLAWWYILAYGPTCWFPRRIYWGMGPHAGSIQYIYSSPWAHMLASGLYIQTQWAHMLFALEVYKISWMGPHANWP